MLKPARPAVEVIVAIIVNPGHGLRPVLQRREEFNEDSGQFLILLFTLRQIIRGQENKFIDNHSVWISREGINSYK